MKKFRLTFVIAFTVIFFMLAVAVAFSFLHSVASRGFANDFTISSINSSSTEIQKFTQNLFYPAVNSAQFLKDYIKNNSFDIRSTDSLDSILVGLLERSEGVYTVYAGFKDGSFYLAGRRKYLDYSDKLWFFVKKVVLSDEGRTVYEKWIDPEDKTKYMIKTLTDDRYDPRSRPWYKKSLAKNGRIWTDPYKFFITGKPGITYSDVIYVDSELVGVVGADLELSMLSEFLKGVVFSSNTSIMVFNDSYKFIGLSSIPKFKTVKSEFDFFAENPVQEHIKSFLGIRTDSVFDVKMDGVDYKVSIDENYFYGLGFKIAIMTPLDDFFSLLKVRENQMFFVILCLLFLAIVISFFISMKIVKPLKELDDSAKNMARLDFKITDPIDSVYKEIDQFTKSFNIMRENIVKYRENNSILENHLRNAHEDTLMRLAIAAEFKDRCTSEHLSRVSNLSVILGRYYGLSYNETNLLRIASPMHDVGKLGIDDKILLKPGPLNSEEWEIMKQHPVIGGKILENPSSEIMEVSRLISVCHHEKWNGDGYPYGIRENQISVYGRIVALSDVFDALLSKRSYKPAFSFEDSVNIILKGKGSHFEPEIINIFTDHLEELKKVL